jgi:valyl-tRNA synthetase
MRVDGLPYAEAAQIAQEVAEGQRTLNEAEADLVNLVPDHLRGLDRFEARAQVIAEVTEEGLAVMTRADDARLGSAAAAEVSPDDPPVPLVEDKVITQPFGDRSKVVIEPMLTDQWFVDTDKIVGPALEAVRSGEIRIIPESGEKTYYHWLENIEPWTISRQLWWGHQIPVWYGPALEEVDGRQVLDFDAGKLVHFCAPNADAARAKAAAYYGVAGPEAISLVRATDREARGVEPDDPLTRAAGATLRRDFDGEAFLPIWRDADVLDTWFSSGLWPMGTLGWPEDTDAFRRYFPTDVLITGFDIIFFWVARMIMMQKAVADEWPFHTVYLHQLVRDEKGKKMSKTTGNVLDPLELIDEYGADAVRFTNASIASIGGVLKLSKDRIQGYRNFGTKLWNAARFAEMNDCKPADGFDPAAVTQTVNRWIVGETARARMAHDEALAGYRFNDAANGLYAFVWHKVCDWYLEFAKPLFASGDEAVIAETRATMAWVIDQCLVLLHPTMPFITEELWGEITTRPKMLIHADWPDYGAELIDADADREMTWVIGLIDEIRSIRAQMHVPAGLKVQLMQAELDAGGQGAFDRNRAMIDRLARLSEVTVVDTLPKGAVTVAVEGGVFGLPIADLIDVDEEKARLEKVLGKLAKEIGGLKGRLSNPKFAESAPEEVVEETRENLSQREEEEGKIRAALARLDEIG